MTNAEKYIITDAVSKAILIDLPTYIVFGSSAVATRTASAVGGYFIRTLAREAEHEYIGGVLGGAFKYGLRGDSALKGSLNAFLYEVTKTNVKIDNFFISTTIATAIEIVDAGNNLEGAASAFATAAAAKLLYEPMIGSIHNMVDAIHPAVEINLTSLSIATMQIPGYVYNNFAIPSSKDLSTLANNIANDAWGLPGDIGVGISKWLFDDIGNEL